MKWVVANNPSDKQDRIKAQYYLDDVEKAIENCLISLDGSELLYAFSSSKETYESLKKSIAFKLSQMKPKEERSIDSNGNIVIKATQTNSNTASLYSDRLWSAFDSQSSPPFKGIYYYTPALIISWDKSGVVLKNIYPEIQKNLQSRIEFATNANAAKVAADEKWKKDDADKKAAFNNENQARLDAHNKFASSPDGKLIISYQYFQGLQVCFDIRKGYAAKYVNDIEFSDISKKIKSIENTLKPTLKEKNTEKLWSEAAKRNEKYDPIAGTFLSNYGAVGTNYDLLNMIKSTNFISANKECKDIFQRFNVISDEILGKDAPKKSF